MYDIEKDPIEGRNVCLYCLSLFYI